MEKAGEVESLGTEAQLFHLPAAGSARQQRCFHLNAASWSQTERGNHTKRKLKGFGVFQTAPQPWHRALPCQGIAVDLGQQQPSSALRLVLGGGIQREGENVSLVPRSHQGKGPATGLRLSSSAARLPPRLLNYFLSSALEFLLWSKHRKG